MISRRRLAVVAVLLAASCSTDRDEPAPSPSPSPISSPSAVATPAATPSPSTSPPAPTPSAAAAVPVCGAAQLRLTVVEADSGAGQYHQRVILTNRRAACTLHGYPGVSFIDAQGRTLGSPADKSESVVRRVLLAPGGSASAVLTYSNAGAFPDSTCRPTTADRLRVYPPGSRVALFVKDAVLVCSAPGSDQLHIGPLSS